MTKKTDDAPKLECMKCNKVQPRINNFYNSNSKLFGDKVPICKKCIKSMIDYSDMDTIYNTLQQLDITFDFEYWEKAENSKSDTFGRYITMSNSLPQLKGRSWKDSRFSNSKSNNVDESSNKSHIDVEYIDDFEVTPELIKKWGKNYESNDYFKLEDFYTKMIQSNKIESAQDITYLKKLSVISLKMDKELDEGNYSQVKQLGDLFSKYMADSKFRAMDQTDASKTGGLRTFSQIYSEVEKDGFIPPWEEYRELKGLEQDIVDRTIMYILNYTLKINKVASLTEPPEDTPKIDSDSGDLDE